MDFADFGRYLSQQRELRGMSVEDVCRTTRIPGNVITALESGQVDSLPARVFVIHYIRAYAQVIGLSPEEAVLRFEEIDRTAASTPPPAALERIRKRQALLRLVLAFCAGVALLGLVYLLLFKGR